MANRHGSKTVVLMDEFNLTGYLNNVDLPQTMEVHETTVFGKTSKTYIPGLKDGTLSLGGLWDDSAGASDVVLQGTVSNSSQTTKQFLIGMNGLTRGNRAYLINSYAQSYTAGMPVGDVVSFSYDAQCGGDTFTSVAVPGVAGGVSLHDLTAVTATGNDASVDNTASSANGLEAFLHCTATTAAADGTMNVDVAESANDAAWADIVNFTQLTTAVTKERKCKSGTIARYLRAEKTKGGVETPSWTIAVAVARL